MMKSVAESKWLLIRINEAMQVQHEKFGKEPLATADDFIRILGEEFGEICRSYNQQFSPEICKIEVIQCIAVCIAWLQGNLHYGKQA